MYVCMHISMLQYAYTPEKATQYTNVPYQTTIEPGIHLIKHQIVNYLALELEGSESCFEKEAEPTATTESNRDSNLWRLGRQRWCKTS